jgi:hypothetical protein
MKGIENKIKKNRDAFNSEEPAPDHLKRFGEKLDALHAEEAESWFERHGMAMRIAAAALIFIAIGSFFYSDMYNRVRDSISDRIVAAELPAELKEVMQYYNVITDQKVNQIDELAISDDEASRVKEMALRELQALEDNRAELEKEYALNPNNERIMNALLLNQQKRSEILDKIINTLSQVN